MKTRALPWLACSPNLWCRAWHVWLSPMNQNHRRVPRRKPGHAPSVQKCALKVPQTKSPGYEVRGQRDDPQGWVSQSNRRLSAPHFLPEGIFGKGGGSIRATIMSQKRSAGFLLPRGEMFVGVRAAGPECTRTTRSF